MSDNLNSKRNKTFILSGLGIALLIGVFLSPFASQDPDGLDRVSQDLKFEDKAAENPPAHKLPFYTIFDEYALRGVPEQIATPLAGLVGTLATFGLAWGVGKLAVRKSSVAEDADTERDRTLRS
jgi:cobalt/nickel transport protein